MHDPLSVLVLLPALLLQVLTAWAGQRRVRGGPVDPEPVEWPDLHLLFPLGRWQNGWEKPLKAWFEASYPGRKVLHFCPDNEESPWTVQVRKLMKRYPHVSASIRFLKPSGRVNPKVEKLGVLASRLESGLVWICDAGVFPSHEKQVQREVATMIHRRRDATFFDYRVQSPRGRWARIEALYLGRHVAGAMNLSWSLFRFPLVVGKSLILSLEALRIRGGMAALENYLAEDQVLGEDWLHSGARMGPGQEPMTLINPRVHLAALANRLGRWARLRSLLHPWLTVGEVLAGWPAGLLALGLLEGWIWGAGSLGFWLVMEGILRFAKGERRTVREMLEGLMDGVLLGLLSTFCLIWGLMGHRVSWQDTRVRLGRRTRICRIEEEGHTWRVHST